MANKNTDSILDAMQDSGYAPILLWGWLQKESRKNPCRLFSEQEISTVLGFKLKSSRAMLNRFYNDRLLYRLIRPGGRTFYRVAGRH